MAPNITILMDIKHTIVNVTMTIVTTAHFLLIGDTIWLNLSSSQY